MDVADSARGVNLTMHERAKIRNIIKPFLKKLPKIVAKIQKEYPQVALKPVIFV